LGAASLLDDEFACVNSSFRVSSGPGRRASDLSTIRIRDNSLPE
jgi:hypothetical protein